MSDALRREQVKAWTVREVNAECAACRWVAESDHIVLCARLEAMTQQIAKLEERLEIGYAFDTMGIRVADSTMSLDGIECRNETIRLQDEALADLTAKLETMRQERDIAEQEKIEWVRRGERAEDAWAEANTAAIIERADRMTAQARVAELERQLTTVTAERDAFLHGGVTEELLRKQNGSIKVGHGCLIVLGDEWRSLLGLRESLEGVQAHLAASEQRVRELEERLQVTVEKLARLQAFVDTSQWKRDLTTVERERDGARQQLTAAQAKFEGQVDATQALTAQHEEIGRLRGFARAVKTGLDFEVHEGRSLSRLEDLYDQAKALAGEKEGT